MSDAGDFTSCHASNLCDDALINGGNTVLGLERTAGFLGLFSLVLVVLALLCSLGIALLLIWSLFRKKKTEMVNNGYARCSKQYSQGALGGIHDRFLLTDLGFAVIFAVLIVRRYQMWFRIILFYAMNHTTQKVVFCAIICHKYWKMKLPCHPIVKQEDIPTRLHRRVGSIIAEPHCAQCWPAALLRQTLESNSTVAVQ